MCRHTGGAACGSPGQDGNRISFSRRLPVVRRSCPAPPGPHGRVRAQAGRDPICWRNPPARQQGMSHGCGQRPARGGHGALSLESRPTLITSTAVVQTSLLSPPLPSPPEVRPPQSSQNHWCETHTFNSATSSQTRVEGRSKSPPRTDHDCGIEEPPARPTLLSLLDFCLA